MKLIAKILTAIFLILIVCFIYYAYELRKMSLDGNRIFGYRCTDVNPSLIAYKNSFLNFAEYINNPEKYLSEEDDNFFYDYLFYVHEYVMAEDKWLEKQKKFMG